MTNQLQRHPIGLALVVPDDVQDKEEAGDRRLAVIRNDRACTMNWLRKASDRPQPRIKSEINLQTEFVMINPPESSDQDADIDYDVPKGCVLTGHLQVSAEPYLNVRAVEIRLEALYRYLHEPKVWKQGVIFNLHRSFNPEEVVTTLSEDGTLLHHKLYFAITIPSSMPTFEQTRTAGMTHQVIASTEFGVNSTSPGFLKGIRRNSSVEQLERLQSNPPDLETQSFSGGYVYMPMRELSINVIARS